MSPFLIVWVLGSPEASPVGTGLGLPVATELLMLGIVGLITVPEPTAGLVTGGRDAAGTAEGTVAGATEGSVVLVLFAVLPLGSRSTTGAWFSGTELHAVSIEATKPNRPICVAIGLLICFIKKASVSKYGY